MIYAVIASLRLECPYAYCRKSTCNVPRASWNSLISHRFKDPGHFSDNSAVKESSTPDKVIHVESSTWDHGALDYSMDHDARQPVEGRCICCGNFVLSSWSQSNESRDVSRKRSSTEGNFSSIFTTRTMSVSKGRKSFEIARVKSLALRQN